MRAARLIVAVAAVAALAVVPSAFAGPGVPFTGQDDAGLNADVGASDTATLMITNSDTVVHTIDTVTTSGDNEFTNGNACNGSVLNPGDQCSVGVTFSPTSLGVKTAQLDVAYDSGSTQNGVSDLTGTGTPPPATNPPTFTPTTRDFGNATVGQGGASIQYTLHNPNLGPLAVNSITVGGINPGAFKNPGDSCSGTNVPGNGTCTFTIRYYASAVDNQSAAIQVNDAIGTHGFTVTGSGSSPAPFTGLLGSAGCSASTLTWNVAAGTFGSWIVRNANHVPQSPSDGTRKLRTSTGVLLDSGLKQFHTYYYAIYAQYKTDAPDGNGQVVYSPAKRISLHTGRICKPQNAAHITSTTPLIDWTAVANATGYGIKIYNHGTLIQSKSWATTRSNYQVPASWKYPQTTRSLKHGQLYQVYAFAYSKKHPLGIGIGSSKFTVN